MQRNNSNQTDATERFWDNHLKYISNKGVNPQVARWYVIRAEQYIKAFSDKRLTEHGPEDVVRHFEQQGRLDRIADWQFRQIVDAIQSLFAMLDVPWLDMVDWQYYMDSSVSLAESHATIAREIPAEETIDRLAKREASPLAAVRKSHKELLSG